MTRVCASCLVEKDLEEFFKHPDCVDGRRRQCKMCVRASAPIVVPRPKGHRAPKRKPCKGCRKEFAPRTHRQTYCTQPCFLKHRKPWTTRKAPVGSLRHRLIQMGLCACSKCLVGRAEAVARKAARDAGRQTDPDAIAVFQERIDRERTGRLKQVVPFLAGE